MKYTVISVDKGWVGELDGTHKIRPNFTVSELACKDGSDVILVSSELLDFVQEIRDKVKVPITINSFYRTVSYNEKIGGAPKSKHKIGMACDMLVPVGYTVDSFAKIIEAIVGENSGIGKYYKSNFVHLDVAKNGKRRWTD